MSKKAGNRGEGSEGIQWAAIDRVIRKTVKVAVGEAIVAGRAMAVSNSKEAFKATERRLYAIPVLEKKIADDKAKLVELRTIGSPEYSKSIVRYQRSGYRTSPEEMLEAMVQDLEAKVSMDENELSLIYDILHGFESDPYYRVVVDRYINRYEDEDIAADMDCGASTVWRNRVRIVNDIATLLYGSSGQ